MSGTTTEHNPLSDVIDTSEINDGSGLAAGAEGIFATAVGAIRSALKTAVRAAREVSKQNKAIAYHSVQLLFSVRDQNGYPIVSLENDKAPEAVKLVMDALYNEAFPIPADASDDEKREIRKLRSDNLTSVRLFRKRVFLEPAVFDHVLKNHQFSDEQKAQLLTPGFLKYGQPDKDYPEVVPPLQCPKFMQKPCAEIFKKSGLDVPEIFGGEKPDGNTSGNKDKKIKPEVFDKEASETIGHFTPLRATQSVGSLVKSLARNMLATGEINDRPEVSLEIGVILSTLNLLQKHVDAKITDKERTTLDGLIELPDVLAALKDEMEKAKVNV